MKIFQEKGSKSEKKSTKLTLAVGLLVGFTGLVVGPFVGPTGFVVGPFDGLPVGFFVGYYCVNVKPR